MPGVPPSHHLVVLLTAGASKSKFIGTLLSAWIVYGVERPVFHGR